MDFPPNGGSAYGGIPYAFWQSFAKNAIILLRTDHLKSWRIYAFFKKPCERHINLARAIREPAI
ncbi:MAG: hypothetical protein ACD_76C00097G0005 [uncultured bacterium]|nr:MAG: hypothetical protein ACD_76C00097G0005 [uncultured bacterium]HBD05701.1 hypothetical protein [Candidatus Uhrbacteria bacterium]